MKFRITTLLLILLCSLNIWSQTGNRSNWQSVTKQQTTAVSPTDSLDFTIDLENENGIYISPQPILFTIRAKTSTDKLPVKLICRITTDTYLPVDSLVFAVKPESLGKFVQPVSFFPPDAGFYRISITAESEGTRSATKKINLGYNPEQIVSPPDAKNDFIEFWENTRIKLGKVKPHYKKTLLKDKCSDTKNMYHVEMYSFGNIKIEGYYSVPKKAGKHPAIIRYMGYGANPRFPDPNVLPDFCEFILSVRGQGIQKTVNTYGDWIVYGLSDKDTYYYRGAYMDLIRGIDFLSSCSEVDSDKIMAEGGSQGGAFTLVACAFDKRIKAAAPRIPFLSDFRDYFKICAWPRSSFENYLKKHPSESWEKIYDVLSYFDIKNLAGQITCPIVMGVGLQDETCPPHTNFAGYNQIGSEKKYYVYPDQKHSVGEDWWQIRESFFREKLSIPLPE